MNTNTMVQFDKKHTQLIGVTAAILHEYLKSHPLLTLAGLSISYEEIRRDLPFLTKKQISDNINVLVDYGFIFRVRQGEGSASAIYRILAS